MDLILPEKAVYKKTIKKLFPQGAYWENVFSNEDSDLNKICDVKADNLLIFRERLLQLVKESYPTTCEETIEDWERVLLNDSNKTLPLSERKELLFNQQNYILICETLYNVSIQEKSPFSISLLGKAKFGQTRCVSQAAFSVKFVNIVSSSGNFDKTKLEEFYTKKSLANSILYFLYRVEDKTHENLEEIASISKLAITSENPYSRGKFVSARFGQSRLGSAESSYVFFVSIPEYTPLWRRFDIESAVKKTISAAIIYFIYNKEAIYGGIVS